jgi:predicted transcriptional regulator
VNSWIAENSAKRRDKLGIISEILEIAKEGTLKTQIMYKANLSYAQLNDYLKFMLKNGLLQKFVSSRKDVYAVTEKGIDFLQRHGELTELLKENDKGKNGVKLPPQNFYKKSQ